MKTSENGKELIKGFEGFADKTYTCAGGKKTIGWGSTTYRKDGIVRQVKDGMKITKDQAEQFLKDDLEIFENAVNNLVTVDLIQNQFDALISLTYNIGIANFKSSTLLKKLNQGDYKGASNEFDRWVFANKKKLQGLVNRRASEKKLFLKGV